MRRRTPTAAIGDSISVFAVIISGLYQRQLFSSLLFSTNIMAFHTDLTFYHSSSITWMIALHLMNITFCTNSFRLRNVLTVDRPILIHTMHEDTNSVPAVSIWIAEKVGDVEPSQLFVQPADKCCSAEQPPRGLLSIPPPRYEDVEPGFHW